VTPPTLRATFGPFLIDAAARQLRRGDEDVHLSPKAFDLLCLLVAASPQVVTKEQLLDGIWPGTFVVESGLNVLVGEVRRALGDSASTPRFVRTAHGRGFAFAAAVARLDGPPTVPPASAPARGPQESTGFWLMDGRRRFALANGENRVGRDPRCGVWLDDSGISRQHAQLTLDATRGRAVIEDLGSKNGTFVRGQRTAGPTPLRDGDVVAFGDVELTYRQWSDRPTATVRRRRP